MVTRIFTAARAALANIPYAEQAKMIQGHNASTRSVRAKNGRSTLKGSAHTLRANDGSIHVFHVLSEGGGIAAENVFIMTAAEARWAMYSLSSKQRR